MQPFFFLWPNDWLVWLVKRWAMMAMKVVCKNSRFFPNIECFCSMNDPSSIICIFWSGIFYQNFYQRKWPLLQALCLAKYSISPASLLIHTDTKQFIGISSPGISWSSAECAVCSLIVLVVQLSLVTLEIKTAKVIIRHVSLCLFELRHILDSHRHTERSDYNSH